MSTKITITLTDAALDVINAAIADDDSVSVDSFVETLIEKVLEQRKVQFARSRLNAGKKHICINIKRENKGYESLEQAYISLGLSNDVETFGGIRKVYDEIYVKSGFALAPSQIRLHNIVAVPPAQKEA
jgi:hypothetical protein